MKTINPKSVFESVRRLEASKDLVQELYYTKYKDSNEIGLMFGVSGVTVREKMERWGFPRKPRGPKRVRKIFVKCSNCGVFLRRTLMALKVYKKAFCNLNCHNQWMSRNFTGVNSPTYGRRASQESIERNRAAAKERWKDPEWQLLMSKIGKKRWEDPSYRQRQSEVHKEKWKDPQYREKQVRIAKRLWSNPEYREARIRAIFKGLSKRGLNKKELELLDFFQEYSFPYNFVGDGSVLLGGKNPDFINTDGQKKLIELYGDHWHRNEKFENGGDNGRARKAIFQEFGFQTLIVWEHELIDKATLLKKVRVFHKEKEG